MIRNDSCVCFEVFDGHVWQGEIDSIVQATGEEYQISTLYSNCVFQIEIIDNPDGYLMHRSLLAIKRALPGNHIWFLSPNNNNSFSLLKSELMPRNIYQIFKLSKDDLFDPKIGYGDEIALRSSENQFFCAEDGGGKMILANQSKVGPWQRFTIRDGWNAWA